MENFNEFMEIFMTGDYFLVFLVLMLMIFVVLIMALIKTRMQYLEIVNMEKNKVYKGQPSTLGNLILIISNIIFIVINIFSIICKSSICW